MDGSIMNGLGTAIIMVVIIACLLAIGAWELVKWLISNIDISISWK